MKNLKTFEGLDAHYATHSKYAIGKNDVEDSKEKLIKDINDDISGLMKGNKLFKFLEEKTKIQVIEDVYKRMCAPSFTEDEKKMYEKNKKYIIKELLDINK